MKVVKRVKRLEALGRKLDNMINEIDDYLSNEECEYQDAEGNEKLEQVLEDAMDALELAKDHLEDASNELADAIALYYELE